MFTFLLNVCLGCQFTVRRPFNGLISFPAWTTFPMVQCAETRRKRINMPRYLLVFLCKQVVLGAAERAVTDR